VVWRHASRRALLHAEKEIDYFIWNTATCMDDTLNTQEGGTTVSHVEHAALRHIGHFSHFI
jgi:hypothetical protein